MDLLSSVYAEIPCVASPRIVNHTDDSVTVSIRTFDGGRAFEPTALSLNAWEVKHSKSDDLEMGSSSKGINGAGGGMGDWHLMLESNLDIEVPAYVHTADGFLTNVHDKVRKPNRTGRLTHE